MSAVLDDTRESFGREMMYSELVEIRRERGKGLKFLGDATVEELGRVDIDATTGEWLAGIRDLLLNEGYSGSQRLASVLYPDDSQDEIEERADQLRLRLHQNEDS